jgi:hypothetical protein
MTVYFDAQLSQLMCYTQLGLWVWLVTGIRNVVHLTISLSEKGFKTSVPYRFTRTSTKHKHVLTKKTHQWPTQREQLQSWHFRNAPLKLLNFENRSSEKFPTNFWEWELALFPHHNYVNCSNPLCRRKCWNVLRKDLKDTITDHVKVLEKDKTFF